MTQSYGFDRGDCTLSSTKSTCGSFFDWNSEMKAANQNNIVDANNTTAQRGAEPDYIEFDDLDEGDRTITLASKPGDRVVYHYDTKNSQTVQWDGRDYQRDQSGNDDRSQQRQEQRTQEQQLREAFQNFVKALVMLCMLWRQMAPQYSTGYGGKGGDYQPNTPWRPVNSDNSPSPAGGDEPRPERPTPRRPATPRVNAGGDISRGNLGGETSRSPGRPNTDNSNQTGNDGNDGRGTTPAKDSENDAASRGQYADTGISRGRTIFRDDFNGRRGEQPNRSVFDTAHIGIDGNQRQRGPSIHENAITDEDNTVQDGNGHLQLFPKKERTYDEKGKEWVDYTKGTYNTTKGLHFNLKDHPEGVVVEVRAKHPTRDGAKFNALWIMTDHWGADPKKGEKERDTIEYDAAEGGGADIAIHYPVKDAVTGKTQDHYGGGAHPDIDFNDGKFHTYTVVITPNAKTGRGDVVQYVDGKKVLERENIFPGDKELHLRSSLEVSPHWTGKKLTGEGGMDSDAAGVIDYVDVSELKRKG